jgi:hypothetical protein
MNLPFMNILDVSSEMRDSAKSSLAVVTFMWLVMVSLVLPVKLSVSAGPPNTCVREEKLADELALLGMF